MTVGAVRSGLVEVIHPVSAVALDDSGAVIETLGEDLDREFFMRSAPKPLQAAVSQRNGADLGPEQLAVAAASHSGFPVHVAHVSAMLAEVDLSVDDLLCPPSRPLSPSADRLWASLGRSEKERVLHNCSGKHAGMLRACRSRGWSLEYTAPDHPLQREIVELAAEASGRRVEPVGVDGCGVPTLRTDVTGLARVFGRLVNDEQFAEVSDAAARFAPLTAGGSRPEAALAKWVPSVVKGGAEGCIGLGMLEHGVAFAAKSWTGDLGAAVVALIEIMMRVGVIPAHQAEQLARIAHPEILGGGEPVGSLELIEGSM